MNEVKVIRGAARCVGLSLALSFFPGERERERKEEGKNKREEEKGDDFWGRRCDMV